MKKAFTLIELLVVIAIIAILAAILFPVFAQAKAAAKKAASISNSKQEVLALIMYADDYDDLFPIIFNSDINANPPAIFNNGGSGYAPWPWLILPYVKTNQLYTDPQAPSNAPLPAPAPADLVNALEPQYGYDYQALDPMTSTNGGAVPFSQAPVSQSSLDRPAGTVAIANKFSNTEDSLGPGQYYSGGPQSWTTTTTVEAPWCSTNFAVGCFTSWGNNSFYNGPSGYLKSQAAGNQTGGVSLRAGNQAVVGWADGHVNSSAPGSLAKGTNWYMGIDASAVQMVDPTQYQWGAYRP
ncbi:MAG TPA: prepilin-type N-terminal cleavage/methylation domain-containing protein [Fimbriimonas sp.]|nr:prepilin-type N-terminal cleavage/methylation domain-containing protein [Fimbriimonas sp.]